MSEKEELAKIEDKLQKMASPGIRPGLARLSRLLYEAGMPQCRFPAVHIAGTNGKGSVAASLYSILMSSGYSAALYTSPHLVDFSERLLVNGQRIPAADWHGALEEIEAILNRTPFFAGGNIPTYFELTTAAAIMITSCAKPDIAVFETGMGGRLDATNVLKDVRLSIITPIGLDHTEYLGDTIEKVAAEKFAIMRRGTPALFAGDAALNGQFLRRASCAGAVPCIFSETYAMTGVSCTLRGCDFTLDDNASGQSVSYHTSLIGTFQPENVSLSIAAAEILKSDFPKITRESIKAGAASVSWPGRMELVSEDPPFLIDGGHNPHAMKRVSETLKLLMPERRVNIVMAMMRDKETESALSCLRGAGAVLYCTEVPGSSRSLRAAEMLDIAEKAGLDTAGSFDDPIAAVRAARSERSPLLCCGSLFLAGYIKEHFDEL